MTVEEIESMNRLAGTIARRWDALQAEELDHGLDTARARELRAQIHRLTDEWDKLAGTSHR